jgi:purine-binding chemotaxis protein CheW
MSLGSATITGIQWGILMQTPYLMFFLQRAWYAVAASRVREILRLPALAPVSEAPDHIIGVMNYRSHIVPVMDLGLRLGEPPWTHSIDDYVIVFQQESSILGIIVNGVHGVQQIPQETIEVRDALTALNNSGARLVKHLAKLDGTAIMILDHELLLSTASEQSTDVMQAHPAVPAVGWEQSAERAPSGGAIPSNPSEAMPLFFQQAAPWERDILLERARNLATSLEGQSKSQQIPLAIIGLSGEYFGVELEAVREFTDLRRVTPVPCCPNHVVGDMNLRGDILTVVDIRQALQMPVVEAAATAKVMVVPLSDVLVGVLVDQVIDVLNVSPSDLSSLPTTLKSINHTYLRAGVPYQSKMLVILDLLKILNAGELTVNDEV